MSNLDKYVSTDKKDTRSGFGAGLSELGNENENVVGLCADLTGSLKMDAFQEAHPDRFFQVGIAEANMIGLAAGMTSGDKIPFTGTFANFSTGRVYDQIRQSVAYSNKNVKICASHAGLTLGEDGATHQILEDVGLMKMLPNMTVICPCDYNQTKAATKAIAQYEGPVYLRFGRPKVENFTSTDEKFEIGKAQILSEGHDVTIIAYGHLVWKAIEAARVLESKGKSVEKEILDSFHTEDAFKIYNKVFNATISGSWALRAHNYILHSPFLEPEIIRFGLSIPYALRYNQDIYIDWLKNYLPEATKYRWERTKMYPNAKWKTAAGRYVDHGIKYGGKLIPKLKYFDMNPFALWQENKDLISHLTKSYKQITVSEILDSAFERELDELFQKEDIHSKLIALGLKLNLNYLLQE